ncbi:hypothetical protein EDL79_04140 [Ehrlichia ruminantium]|uniref:Uncharacterized protein n=1 Tax=Ehrlichia ruminantium TaxID=779 RepID=A0AAE6QAX9_EHRRU|nr:hypothetical protein [Ehrlichia ruminantium]QGR02803.1 hypothetical protein EDL81_04120 [Ehrlichia ruminantium]QGR03727.1 hypothetical protein EDL80_04130 [Ehrlichia ruminantium]QGR04654.1 hypothetical protein EDL79_04140 [Ehrlichia ruminantium]
MSAKHDDQESGIHPVNNADQVSSSSDPSGPGGSTSVTILSNSSEIKQDSNSGGDTGSDGRNNEGSPNTQLCC